MDPPRNTSLDVHAPNDTDVYHLNVSYVNSNFEAVVFALNKYGLPSLILIGVLGNSVSFIVFTTTHLRTQSSSIYLAFLNVVDVIFLACISFVWLSWVRVYWIHRQGWCQTVVFLSYVSSFLSVWTVVSFTVERCLVVYLPLWKERISTRARALGVVSGLAVFALVSYSYTLWTTAPTLQYGKKECAPLQSHFFLLQILSSIDTFATLAIPSVVIIVLNVLIGRKVWIHMRWRNKALRKPSHRRGEDWRLQRLAMLHVKGPPHRLRIQIQQRQGTGGVIGNEKGMLQNGRDSSEKVPLTARSQDDRPGERRHARPREARPGRGGSPGGSLYVSPGQGRDGLRIHSRDRDIHARQNAAQMRTTRTLLIISSAFVLLNLPSHAFRVCATIIDLTDSAVRFSRTVLLWQHLCQMLYYANFSLNFFMYCTCSKRFRMALQLLLSKQCSRLRGFCKTLSDMVQFLVCRRQDSIEQNGGLGYHDYPRTRRT